MSFFLRGNTSVRSVDRQNGLQGQVSPPRASLHSKNNSQGQDQIVHKRKSMNMFLYSLYIVTMIFMSFQNVIFFFTLASKQKTYYCIFSFTSLTIIMLIISKIFSTFKQMLGLYFLLDTLTLALVVANIGLSGLIQPLAAADLFFADVLTYFAPITSFCMTGTVRVIIKNANFNRYQNVIFKFVILMDGMCYFGIGMYFMYYDFLITKGTLPNIDSLYKDFSLLFVFGGLAYYKQICNLHNRFDRTDKLKYTYKLVDEIELQSDDQQSQIPQQKDPLGHLKQQYKLKRKENADVTIYSVNF